MMHLRFIATPYTILLGATAAILVALVFAIFRSLPRVESRSRRPGVLLIAILLVTAVWCVGYALQLSSADASAAAFWHNVRMMGAVLASPIAFLFVAEYTGRDAWIRTQRTLAVFSIGALTILLTWTNDKHGLVRDAIARTPDGVLFAEVSFGPWAAVYAPYNFLLILGAFAMLAAALRDRNWSRVYRGQAGTVLLALIVPTAANALYALEVTRLDVTPVAFAVSGLAFAASVYRYRLLDIVPIARSTAFDTADLAIFVIDSDGTTVDANAPAAALVDVDAGAIVGTPLRDLFPDRPSIAHDREGTEEVAIDTDGRRRWFDVDVSPVRDSSGRSVGRVLLVNDVSDRRRRQRELRERTAQLERRNEHLDQFAGIVSHDLRNPLNVAQGYLALAAENPDAADLAEVEAALDRMEGIVEDALALARQSGTVDDTEPVDLAELAAASWSTVDTHGASLVVDAAGTVEADERRLRQLFENLFRNAVEHGSDEVTVRVGDLGLDDAHAESRECDPSPRRGFFVEDDGPGIPAGDRETVFDRGYTTDSDGTGLGLAIAKTAVEAHGWSIRATAGTNGGARFEIVTD